MGIDLVLECSRKFRTKEMLAPYLAQGVKKVIVSAPVKSEMVVDGKLVKVLAWYDNEWGYVNRMMELADKIAASL